MKSTINFELTRLISLLICVFWACFASVILLERGRMKSSIKFLTATLFS